MKVPIVILILVNLISFSSNSYDDQIVDFQVIERDNTYSIVHESEDPNVTIIIDDLQKKLNNGEYLNFFTSTSNPTDRKRNTGNVIRVDELSTIREFDSSEELFQEYVQCNSYPVWYVQLSTESNHEYEFIKYEIIDEDVISSYLYFKSDNAYSFILDEKLREEYISKHETFMRDDIYMILIAERPVVFGIVNSSENETLVIPFKSRVADFDINNGDAITINELRKEYKKYNFKQRRFLITRVVIILSIPTLLIAFLVNRYIKHQKSY